MRLTRTFIFLILFIFVTNCATYKPQYSENKLNKVNANNKEIEHSFYLIGDAGNSTLTKNSPALNYLKRKTENTSENATLLFLGDNVYETGIPNKNNENYALAKRRIEAQTDVAKDFKGQSIFIPGNHDWYNGLDGLKREERLVEEVLGKKSFLPQNGCPLEKVNISKDIVLIIVDTHWYLTNWDNHPTINDNCEIKTRTKFFDEFEGLIKKSRGKTTIIAMHHPMFTNGSHGGKYSFASHMKPTPVLGTLKNLIRKSSGITNTDIQNKKYNALKKHLVTISQENDKTIFVSGHDHNLQYIVQDNLPQIISGSGSKTMATKLSGGAKFTYAAQGFAKLDVYKDGSSSVSFHTVKDDKIVYQTEVLPPNEKKVFNTFPKNKITEKKASIYTKEEVTKNGLYRYFWGERYRKYFGTEVSAPTVDLDTLFGGLKPVRKGGGHQSKSLRLKDKKGREYVMRALRKNAVQYLQAVAFKDQYIEGQFDNTKTEGLLMDVFTGSHPYAPFTIGKLSDAIGVYHTNPVLYYIPKQNSLGHFNSEFGDELYMIEERAASGHGDKASFGFADEVISTDDLLKNLTKSENHVIDEGSYIKARLFDMLIGDFDRHEDQWRWAVFKEGKQTIYRPIPRDRDQAFSIMGDGALLGFATNNVPTLRGMRAYSEELKSPKWFNLSPNALDMSLIKSDKQHWDAQVKLITSKITDEIIDDAFSLFPDEVKDETISEIKRKLQGRRRNLQKISDSYYNHLNEYQVIKGTNKDDWFDIERLPNGQTKVTGYRIKKGEKSTIFHQRTYSTSKTKEIWIYGLDDDDTFIVKGEAKDLIKIRIIGGQNNDTYTIQNGKKVKIYDQKSKKNTFTNNNGSIKLTDDYETNVYNYKKIPNSLNIINPSIWFNPDDGIKLGLVNVLTINKFERNPYTSQHILSGAFYFATNGFELDYSSEFANVIGKWNLGIEAHFTSPNFAINYFGLGNSSLNPEADKEESNLDFNRVKIKKLTAGTSLNWKGDLGAKIKIGANYQNYKVENTPDRFINTQFNANNPIFSNQNFLNTEASYEFENTDNPAFTTNGMKTELKVGYTANLQNANSFSYLIPSISFNQKLSDSGKLVFATKLHSHFTFGSGYEFYQAASIGGNKHGLRGYRNQRFTGKNSFYHTSDVRLLLSTIKTSLVPLNVGIYGGFDYGKVWGTPSLPSTSFNTSYGAGVFFNAANMLGANIAAFQSEDGMRLAVGLGFKF
ncbi:phosphoesterase [Tenacibaculum todarodis]|uniref:Phosphoesterase n=1 Tax=Tenacibaculum todarodis TaxID=1850252 RepID=A0A1L3JK63_9FLAO|nr:metallophosphoesterase [Tenacibaculum todarodis]APG65483.1 phosphoesterase [Tenacibaculum todarodis]